MNRIIILNGVMKMYPIDGNEVLNKRCPFCNSYATISKIQKCEGQFHYDNWLIKCKKCPAKMDIAADTWYDRKAYTKEEAIEFWNTRGKENG